MSFGFLSLSLCRTACLAQRRGVLSAAFHEYAYESIRPDPSRRRDHIAPPQDDRQGSSAARPAVSRAYYVLIDGRGKGRGGRTLRPPPEPQVLPCPSECVHGTRCNHGSHRSEHVPSHPGQHLPSSITPSFSPPFPGKSPSGSRLPSPSPSLPGTSPSGPTPLGTSPCPRVQLGRLQPPSAPSTCALGEPALPSRGH